MCVHCGGQFGWTSFDSLDVQGLIVWVHWVWQFGCTGLDSLRVLG